MLISQTFRGSPELGKEGFILLQKWYRLTNAEKHEIIKEVLADGLNSDVPGRAIRQRLAYAINKAVPNSAIENLQY